MKRIAIEANKFNLRIDTNRGYILNLACNYVYRES